MGEFRKLTVDMDEASAAIIDKVVAEGRFADAAEVLRHAMQLFDESERDHEQSCQDLVDRLGLEKLREMIDEGFASGEPIEVTDEFYEDVKRRGELGSKAPALTPANHSSSAGHRASAG